MKIRYILILLLIICWSCDSNKINDEIINDPFIYKHGRLDEGQSLAQAILSQNIETAEVYKVVNKLNSVYDLRKSHPADSFVVKLDSLNNIHELVYYPQDYKIYKIKLDTLDMVYAEIDTIKINKVIRRCDGEIKTSLYQAMIDRGEGGALPVLFSQIFQWDIDFFIDPQVGDQFHLVYEQYMNDNKFVEYGNILVAQYISGSYNSIAYGYKNKKGIEKYYNQLGKSFQKAFLKSPLNYKRISSYFGNRYHPITRKTSFHNGVDYAAAYGTPVEATADGTVIKASWNKRHTGETVKIRHANGYVTLYGHLSKYGRFKVGNRVKQHDVIGYVGSTGRSTGPHLHYTIYHHGNAINPLKLKNVSGPPIPQTEMKLFQIKIDSLKNLLNQKTASFFEKETIQDSSSTEQNIPAINKINSSKDLIIVILIILIIFLLILQFKRKRFDK